MNDFDNLPQNDIHFSKTIRAGKRTYYFDIKSTRSNDYYLTITESKRIQGEGHEPSSFQKHKIFLFKEDFEKFTVGLTEVLDYIKVNTHEEISNEKVNSNGEEIRRGRFLSADIDDHTK